MCNCNQTRASYAAPNNSAHKALVAVKRTQNNPLVLQGKFTGRLYKFRNINDVCWVDQRDVGVLQGVQGLQIV
jgi:hypothetical protein